jgi:hypothetical protein
MKASSLAVSSLAAALTVVSFACAQAQTINKQTTTSGGGTTTTTQGTTTFKGTTYYGQQKEFSTSTSPGSNPYNSQSSTGVGVQFEIPQSSKKK